MDSILEFPKSLFVTIRNREKVVFQGEAKALTSLNEAGPFDVLPEHENFISIIKNTLILHKAGGGREELKIDGGVIKVFNNKVEVYLGLVPHETTM